MAEPSSVRRADSPEALSKPLSGTYGDNNHHPFHMETMGGFGFFFFFKKKNSLHHRDVFQPLLYHIHHIPKSSTVLIPKKNK